MNVAEVGLGAYTGAMAEWNERLLPIATSSLEVTAYLVVTAGVAMLGNEAAKDLHGGVALLARSRPVGDKDVLDPIAERPEDWCGPCGGSRPNGFGLLERLRTVFAE